LDILRRDARRLGVLGGPYNRVAGFVNRLADSYAKGPALVFDDLRRFNNCDRMKQRDFVLI
jgi:hypothetical protein